MFVSLFVIVRDIILLQIDMLILDQVCCTFAYIGRGRLDDV